MPAKNRSQRTRRFVIAFAVLFPVLIIGYPIVGPHFEEAPREIQPELVVDANVDSMNRIRVMTWNIHHGAGTDGRVDLSRIAEVIANTNPDFVALQEVDRSTHRSGGIDQAARLGELTKMEYVFGKTKSRGNGDYGIAVMSKHPIIASHTIELPRGWFREPRAVLVVEIDLHGVPISFASTHWDFFLNSASRIASAKSLASTFSQWQHPVILGGDLNDTPTSQSVLHLRAGLRRITDGRAMATFPSQSPTREIDHLFVDAESDWQAINLRPIDVAGASDHFAVVADLVIGN